MHRPWKCLCAYSAKVVAPGRMPASHSWEAPNIFIVSLPKSGPWFERHPRHPAGWFNVTFHFCGGTVSFPFRKAPKKFIPPSKKTNKRAPISGWEREAKKLMQSWETKIDPNCTILLCNSVVPNCGHQTSSSSIIWELVRNACSWALPLTSVTLGVGLRNVCFNDFFS